MSPAWIALLVLGIVSLLGLVVLALHWVKARAGAMLALLRAELTKSGEIAALGPELANYRGGTHGFSRTKGLCAIALTDRRLVLRKIIGAQVEVPLHEIVGVREDTWFLRAYHSGWLNVIVQTRAGAEVGFVALDRGAHERWMSRLLAQAAVSAGHAGHPPG